MVEVRRRFATRNTKANGKAGGGYRPRPSGRASLVTAALAGGLAVMLITDLAGPIVREAYAAMAVIDSTNLAKNAETAVSTAKTLGEMIKLVQTSTQHLGLFTEFARSFGGVPGAEGTTLAGGLAALSAGERLLSLNGEGLMASMTTLQAYAPAPERELEDLPWLQAPSGPGGAAPGSNPDASVPADLRELAGGLRDLQSLVQSARTTAQQQPGAFGFSDLSATADVLNRVFRQPGNSNVARLEADRIAMLYTDRAAQKAIAAAWAQRETAADMRTSIQDISEAAKRAKSEDGDLRQQITVLTAATILGVTELVQLRTLLAAQVELDGWGRVSSMPSAFSQRTAPVTADIDTGDAGVFK